MTDSELFKILEAEDQALSDGEYRDLHKKYRLAQDRFAALLTHLPEEQQEIIGDYLYTSVRLFHRLMALACNYTDKKGTA